MKGGETRRGRAEGGDEGELELVFVLDQGGRRDELDAPSPNEIHPQLHHLGTGRVEHGSVSEPF